MMMLLSRLIARKRIKFLRDNVFRRFLNETQETTSSEKVKEETKVEEPLSIEDIAEPTNCCMSGCINCVWIEYAEKLSRLLENSDVDVQKIIMEKVQDPNMRAFLSMELKYKNLIK